MTDAISRQIAFVPKTQSLENLSERDVTGNKIVIDTIE